MKKLHLFASALLMMLFVASCGITDNGFGGSSIQKRKYTKGFYFNKSKHYRGTDNTAKQEDLSVAGEEVAVADPSVTPLKTKSVNAVPGGGPKQIESGKNEQQQRSEEKSKKKSTQQVRKENKTTPVARHRKPREHEFYIPMAQKSKQQSVSSAANSNDDMLMLVLLVILALIIPPLAVAIYEGITTRFWIDLILAIIGFGVGFWLLGGLGWLCALAAVIYALLIVLGVI